MNPKLRQQIRDARAAVPKRYAQQASYKFSEHFASLEPYQAASKVAGYLPFEGEADPMPLMDRAIQEGKQVFVPIIVGKSKPLKFAAWTRESTTKQNSFGIAEPDVAPENLIDANELDFVITPLVAFDEKCNRIGVGGGFYDRSFAFLNEANPADRKTKLVGIAYELQLVDKIKPEPWDVQMDAVVTELQVRTRSSR